MNLKSCFCSGLKWGARILPVLPALASAQAFFNSASGDVDLGFRKTGAFQEQYEMVVYLGNISNFMAQAAGTQITISNFNSVQLSNMCPDGFGNLQWSVFSAFQGTISNSSGLWPRYSCWYTVPRTNASVPTTAIARLPSSNESLLEQNMISTGTGANGISQQLITTQGNTNINNNSLVVLEPINLNPAASLTAFIGDRSDSAFGDFGGSTIVFSVENTTPNNFTTPSVSDFYVNVPHSTSPGFTYIDPLTGLANGTSDYLGYFTLNPNGTMTFTRAAATGAAPAAGFSGSPLIGFAPLQAMFTDSSTGTVTNWVWNFGDGQSVTNTTSASVNHTYSTAGSYTVTLTVSGPGGSDAKVQSAYVVASSAPQLGSPTASGGNLVFGGSNCPAGVQYRILASTNLELSVNQWQPVATNTFLNDGTFHYTNTTTAGQNAFFRLVSP